MVTFHSKEHTYEQTILFVQKILLALYLLCFVKGFEQKGYFIFSRIAKF